MSISRTFARIFAFVVLGFVSTANADVVYDAVADYNVGYNSGSNPNGVWSYGWTPSLAGTLTLYANHGVYAGLFDAWYDPTSGLHSPLLYKNNGGDVQNSNIQIPAGALILHGGSVTATNNFSTVIFTAPNAGQYSLSTVFTGRQIGGELASVNVLDNGSSLFSSSVIYAQSQSFSRTLNLTKGETISFAVGYVNSVSVDGDSVQLQATLTAVPEPSAFFSCLTALTIFSAYALRKRARLQMS